MEYQIHDRIKMEYQIHDHIKMEYIMSQLVLKIDTNQVNK